MPVQEISPKTAIATCPYCRQRPLELLPVLQTWPTGQVVMLVLCAQCGKPVPYQIVGMKPEPPLNIAGGKPA